MDSLAGTPERAAASLIVTPQPVSPLDVILPVIRLGRGRRPSSRAQLMAVFRDCLVIGSVEKFVPLPPSLFDPDKRMLLAYDKLRRAQDIPLSSVARVHVDLVGDLLPECRLVIALETGARIIHRTALRDCWLLVESLRLLLTDRFSEHRDFARRLAVRRLPPTRRTTRQRLDRQPYRHARLGTALKIGGVCLLSLVFLTVQVRSALDSAQASRFDAMFSPWIALVLLVLGLLLARFGYRLALVPATRILQQDTRPPVVYLRAFSDDGRHSLNPSGLLARILGVEPSLASPLRLVRILRSHAVDTAEEQFARFFARRGPFVAIGDPSDRLPASGAARLYMDATSDWQEMVAQLVRQAQIVVLQPAETEGIWWETCWALGSIPPERILLCLINYQGNQVEYEELRLKMARHVQLALPRAIGDTVLLSFDRDWTPRPLPLRYKPPISWPIAGTVVDFDRTLAPFLTGLEGRTKQVPSVRGGRATFLLNATVALVLWCVGLVGAYVVAGEGVQRAWASLADGRGSDFLGTSEGVLYQGLIAPFEFRLDPSWQLSSSYTGGGTSVRSFILGEPTLMTFSVIEGDSTRASPYASAESLMGSALTGLMSHGGSLVPEASGALIVKGRRWSRIALRTSEGSQARLHTLIGYSGSRGWVLVQIGTSTLLNVDDDALRALMASFVVDGLQGPLDAAR